MSLVLSFLMVLLVLSDLTLLAVSRLPACIRAVAVQGALLGLMPLVLHWPSLSLATVSLSISALALKGVLFPYLLARAMRVVDIRREAEPYVGYAISVVIGFALFAVALLVSSRWQPQDEPGGGRLLLCGAMTMVLTGLFVVVSRRKAISQVLGYLILENGVYAFGLVFVRQTSFLVELAVLLDALMAVLVMGIAIHRIQRGFDHIDVDQLRTLRG